MDRREKPTDRSQPSCQDAEKLRIRQMTMDHINGVDSAKSLDVPDVAIDVSEEAVRRQNGRTFPLEA